MLPHRQPLESRPAGCKLAGGTLLAHGAVASFPTQALLTAMDSGDAAGFDLAISRSRELLSAHRGQAVPTSVADVFQARISRRRG